MEPDHVFLWHIENFSACSHLHGQSITSTPFFAKNRLDSTKWQAVMYPRGNVYADFVALDLVRLSDEGPGKMDFQVEMCIIASDGTDTHSTGIERVESMESQELISYEKLVRRDNILMDRGKYLPGDTLTVKMKLWKEDRPQVPTKTVVQTGIKFEQKCFTWTIKDFGVCHDERKIAISTTKVPELFEMFLFSSAKNDEYTITLRQKVNLSVLAYMDCRLSVLDTKNKMVLSAEGSHYFPENCIGHKWDFPNFIDFGKLKKAGAFPGGVLQLHCDFLIYDGSLESSTIESSLLPDVPTTSLADHVKSLYKNKDFADVILRAKSGHTFKAHKWILGARSPVFRSRFEKMALSQGDKLPVLEIRDLEPSTLRRLLQFVYTDTLDVECMGYDRASCLYTAAYKYQIPLLRLECLTFMRSKFNFNNVFCALMLADVTKESQLRIFAQDYIAEHSQDILLGNIWREFVDMYPHLAAEVLCHLRLKAKETAAEFFNLIREEDSSDDEEDSSDEDD